MAPLAADAQVPDTCPGYVRKRGWLIVMVGWQGSDEVIILRPVTSTEAMTVRADCGEHYAFASDALYVDRPNFRDCPGNSSRESRPESRYYTFMSCQKRIVETKVTHDSV
eukprot:COSAG01_NODE_186_length_22652_cov_7.562630_9_plen_110_part_00